MVLKVIDGDFTVCKIKDIKEVNFEDEFVFVSKTDEELSLVCKTALSPKDCIACEKGWKAMRIDGELDFSLIGILSKITNILAEKGISIFAISTYNTDYILIKSERLDDAISALSQNGYHMVRLG